MYARDESKLWMRGVYLNCADDVLGQNGDEHGHGREPEEAAGEPEDGCFLDLDVALHLQVFRYVLVHLIDKNYFWEGGCAVQLYTDLLWLEELAVRLELEEEVSDVGEEHDDAAGAGEVEDRGGRGHGVLAGAHGVAQHQRQRVA
jgi:hypothetical protein